MPDRRVFARALYRELSVVTASTFFVLLGIVLTQLVVKLLGAAASGGLASEAVAATIGFMALRYTPWILSMSLFVGVLYTLTRAYRDHEMPVWQSSGLAITAWIGPVMRFALPLVFTIGLLSLGLSPWAMRKADEYRDQLARRDDVSTVAPGLFKESAKSDSVYFIENFTGEGGAARNIFVESIKDGMQSITVADEGFLTSMPDGERILVLKHGRRYEGKPGSRAYRMVEFERSQLQVAEGQRNAVSLAVQATDSWTLWRAPWPAYKAELALRAAPPISALLLCLMAIPLAFFNPRVGRVFNIVLALLLFLIYFQLLNLFETQVAQGRIPIWVNLWPVHVAAAVTVLILFYRRLGPPR
ncbi:LPS export ABC transporter permease LptF [Parachitinimonas caeni]|uniref:Lipopolysaccharide export system permease protein LptF n=1 Tax=Parachitinimonas caeni TaxID=3031301 RepID=A0ABT7DSP2_9NEIS|nr:LPS export ABC transporter permease LptF [Parachitinimonas caeni]MDK2123091.1 LPS export ABC transporter permease LptF [Parachitinimonas caeni]